MSEARHRVALCTSELGSGGPERVILTLLRFLDRDTFAPFLVVSDPHDVADVPEDVSVVTVPGRYGARYPVLGLARVLRGLDVSVALGTHRLAAALPAARPLLRGRVRLISRPSNHLSETMRSLQADGGLKPRIANLVQPRVLRWADAIVCQSASLEYDLAYRLGAIPDSLSLARIPNPIDVETVLARTKEPAELPRRGNPTFLSVGRLTVQKGHDRVIRALAAVRARAPQARLWILGDGPDRADLEALAHSCGVDDAVDFCGHQPNPLAHAARADYYVSGSRWEGLSNALIEAQVVGLPAIAFGGPASADEVIVEGATGWVLDHQRPAVLAEAMERLATGSMVFDPDDIRHRTQARFGAEPVTRQYEALFLDQAAR